MRLHGEKGIHGTGRPRSGAGLQRFRRAKGGRDLRAHKVDMVTLGQYLQPSRDHLKVERFVHPDEFEELRVFAEELGFNQVASGPLVRSSYHADKQAHGESVS